MYAEIKISRFLIINTIKQNLEGIYTVMLQDFSQLLTPGSLETLGASTHASDSAVVTAQSFSPC